MRRIVALEICERKEMLFRFWVKGMSAGSYEVGAKGRDFATCPVCGGEDWCFVIFEGESPKINCKREESSEVALNGTVWRKVNETPKLGSNYVLKDALEDFVRGQAGSGVVFRPTPKATPAAIELKPLVLPPQTGVKLLSFDLPELGWHVVGRDSASIEREINYRYPSILIGSIDVGGDRSPISTNGGKTSATGSGSDNKKQSGAGCSSGIGTKGESSCVSSASSLSSTPHRSPVEVMVVRRQWDDRREVYHKKQKVDGSCSAKSKMILPKHRFPGGDWVTGKARIDGRTLDWNLYRWEEVVAHKPPVLCWAAGEKCVEALRGLGYVAVSQAFGENASEAAVVAVVRQVGQALVDGLSQLVLVFVDEDEAGIKFGNQVQRIASQLFPHRFLVCRMPRLGQLVNIDVNCSKKEVEPGKDIPMSDIPYPTCKNKSSGKGNVNDIADLIEILTANQRKDLQRALSTLVSEFHKKNSKDNMNGQKPIPDDDATSVNRSYRNYEDEVGHYVSRSESLSTVGFDAGFVASGYGDSAPLPNTTPGTNRYGQDGVADPCKVWIGHAVVDTARLFGYAHKVGGEQLKPGSADGFARVMGAATSGLSYDSENERWYTFAPSGIWELLPKPDLEKGIRCVIHSIGSSMNRTFLMDVCHFLSLELKREGWGGTDTQIFFPNGKLDVRSGNFTELTEDDLCLGTLSFSYDTTGSTDCPLIREFLELFQGEALVAGIAAAVRQMGYLQRYVHLIGVPGSGKGTCLRLVRACLGKLAVSTTLEGMEGRFETAKFRDARAILIPEGADARIDPTVLKSLTGSDLIAYELKHAQQTSDNSFIFTGIVFLATNRLPRWSESSAGAIKRRALYIQLSSVPSEQKVLLEFARNGDEEILMGEFAAEIPQFFNWVMSLDKASVAENMAQTSTELDMGMFLESNPIAKWFDTCCVANDSLTERGKFILRAIVGTSQNAWSLYYSYSTWCDSTGEKPLSARHFTAELKTLLESQSIPHDFGRSAEGNTFYGICLAGEDTPEFPLSSNGGQWEEDE